VELTHAVLIGVIQMTVCIYWETPLGRSRTVYSHGRLWLVIVRAAYGVWYPQSTKT